MPVDSFDQTRCVMIRVVTKQPGVYRVGSGYAITPELLLTARHVWHGQSGAAPGKMAEARFLRESTWLPVTRDWSSTPGLDACLLRLPDSRPRHNPLRWGHFDRTEPVAWQSLGYPGAAVVHDADEPTALRRDTAELRGMLSAGGAYHQDLLELTMAGAAPQAQLWSGLSGAPVFAQRHLIGMIRAAPSGFGGARLWATPVRRLLEDRGFADATSEPAVHLVPVSILSDQVVTGRMPRSPSNLLHARYRVVPFFEEVRSAELNALREWLEQPDVPSIRLVTGPGGTGKTRLFIEWCRQLRQRGWDAGFLPRTAGADELDALLSRPRDTFVVIDYAETHPHLLATLGRIVRANLASERFHIALVARNGGDWWTVLGQRDDVLLDHIEMSRPIPVAPVRIERDLRRRAFEHAAMAFAEALGKSVADSGAVELEDERFSRMLFIHMAALAAVEGVATGIDGLLARTVDREHRFWEHWCRERGSADWDSNEFRDRAARFMAAITLSGGACRADEAQAICARVAGPAPAFIRFAQRLYPGSGSAGTRNAFLSSLEPDLLGEALVVRILERDAPDCRFLDQVFANPDDVTLYAGFVVLGRISVDRPEQASPWLARLLDADVAGRLSAAFKAALALGESSAFSPLGAILDASLRCVGNAELARQFDDRLPDRTVGLREFCAGVRELMLHALPAPDDAPTRQERARLLDDLGKRYGALGDMESGLRVASQAVTILRELAAGQPETCRRELARSLTHLAAHHRASGHNQRALQNIREAVDILRDLAKGQPSVFLSDLAASLQELGIQHSDLHHGQRALAATLESVAIRRQLVADGAAQELPWLAAGLTNLGSHHSELGHGQQALDAGREAVDIYRRLAGARPDAFLPALALSLNNLSNRYLEAASREKALDCSREAVEIYRRLARSRPAAFQLTLAASLNNLGIQLAESEDERSALDASLEAVELRRQLVLSQPQAFLPTLIASLNNLGLIYARQGASEQASRVLEEAIEHCRELALADPAAHLPRLASSLHNAALAFAAIDDHEHALAAAEEAVHVRRRLLRDGSDVIQPDLAKSLTNLGICLVRVNRAQDAVETLHEAVSHHGELARQTPMHRRDFVWSLQCLARCLEAVGRVPGEDSRYREARALAQGLFDGT